MDARWPEPTTRKIRHAQNAIAKAERKLARQQESVAATTFEIDSLKAQLQLLEAEAKKEAKKDLEATPPV